MPETLIIELRDTGGQANLAGAPRPPQLGPSYQPQPVYTYPGQAGQPAVTFLPPPGPAGPLVPTPAPQPAGRGPETELLGPIRPAVNDLVLGLREARVGLGQFGRELLATSPSKWMQADPFFTRQRAGLIAGTASQTFGQQPGFAGQALSGMANIAGAFAIGGPLFGGLTAFTTALRLGTEWLRMWREKVQEATETLKPFGPQLARQSAIEEVKNLRQDIERARKMDDVLARFVAAQGELTRAQQLFDDKRLRATAEREARGMERQAEALRTLADENATAQERASAMIVAAMNNQTASLVDGMKGIKATVDRIVNDANKDPQLDDFVKQLDEMARLPMEQPDPGPRDPDRRLRFPPLGAAGGV